MLADWLCEASQGDMFPIREVGPMRMSVYSLSHVQKSVSTSQHAVRARKAGNVASFVKKNVQGIWFPFCELRRPLLHGPTGQSTHKRWRRRVIRLAELGGHIQEYVDELEKEELGT